MIVQVVSEGGVHGLANLDLSNARVWGGTIMRVDLMNKKKPKKKNKPTY
jgi:hypothetical protein